MRIGCMVIVCLLGLSSAVYAEGGNCPTGYYPVGGQGASGCAPIPGYPDSESNSEPRTSPVWETRWGAISVDGSSGSLGAVVGLSSEKKAQQAALNKCRTNGGGNCSVDLTYHNQCAVMILGSKKYNTASAATVERATQLGMETCSAVDTSCRVYYSGCSAAQRIQ